ncbi:hypothetical protein pb186bvf_000116 [Paramecium bursaria]
MQQNQDDWYDENIDQREFERQLADKELNQLQKQYETIGYRQGLIEMSDQKEEEIQNKGFYEGFEFSKQQYYNQTLFNENIIRKCNQYLSKEIQMNEIKDCLDNL